MREAFREIAKRLKEHGVNPADVDIAIRFHNERDRDRVAFALGKELEGFKRVPGIPGHVYGGGFYGISFELKERDHAA